MSRPRLRALRHMLRPDPNVAGQAYLLTTFFAIRLGEEHRLQMLLDDIPQAAESPFSALTQLHFARLHILRELEYQGHPQPPDPLRSAYLIFSSSFDGDRRRFVEDLRTRCSAAVEDIWGHCVGFPGTADPVAFHAYVDRSRVDNGYTLTAYEDATVADVRSALALRDRMGDFAVRARRMDARTLQEEFETEFGGAA